MSESSPPRPPSAGSAQSGCHTSGVSVTAARTPRESPTRDRRGAPRFAHERGGQVDGSQRRGAAPIDAYWRAANYLSVGQIYLLDNPLLREPLAPEHVKPRLLGHFGTTPGLNLALRPPEPRDPGARPRTRSSSPGPGTAGPALVANAYLEGTYSEVYPRHRARTRTGMRRLFRQFSFPGGIPSHVAPETPGSIHEGGELGYALVARVRRGVRQPRPARRLRRRRRRGRDRAARRRAGTRTSSSTRAPTAPCCRSST